MNVSYGAGLPRAVRHVHERGLARPRLRRVRAPADARAVAARDLPIGREEMAKRTPSGFQLDKARYEPGDEILLTGVSTFFFPFNEIEVLSPETGLAVVGNDHSKVFIEAIGIDQKSGIYVRDLTTGEAR